MTQGPTYIVEVLIVVSPVISAVLVALLNNWEKFNKGKRTIRDMSIKLTDVETEVKETAYQLAGIEGGMKKISSAQHAILQSSILQDCKVIQDSVRNEKKLYDEALKRLIILFREYYMCGFNSQAKLYFDETLEAAADIDNALVHSLMTYYFPEYDPYNKGHSSRNFVNSII